MRLRAPYALACWLLLTAFQTLQLASDSEKRAPLPTRIQREIVEQERTLRIAGPSERTGQDGELVWSKGCGLSDVAGNIPATPDTTYVVASITKTFASTGIMQ